MKVKHLAEYAGLRVTFAAINILPYRVALATVWPLAWALHWLFRFRTAEARRRIQQVFPDLPPGRVRRIAWISFRNLAFNGVEMMRAGRLTSEWMSEHLDPCNSYDMVDRHLPDRPVIFAVLHMGNWDLGAQALELGGVPSFFIMRSQKNPLTTKLINSGRTAKGGQVLDRDDPTMIRKAVRLLKDGKTMAILVDLRARNEAISVDFLGHKANVAGGVGLMARLSGAVVLPCRVIRRGWTHHEIQVFDEILLDPGAEKNAEIERVTQRALNVLSDEVMRHPEQYFWYNKRWVLEPFSKTDS